MKKTQVITINEEAKTALCDRYGISISGLYNALGFRSNSKRAVEIRRDALAEFGGKKQSKLILSEL